MFRTIFLVGTDVGALLTGGGASATTTAPHVTSVSFSGTVAAPVITIHGHRFGSMPKAVPQKNPPAYAPCVVHPVPKSTASFGHDYGTSLFLTDVSGNPLWGAGRYHANEVGALDCIGLIVSKYTSSTVIFRLGSSYPSYPG